MVAYKQRLYGYGLTGITNEQMFSIHYGTGGNGKSTELNTITHILGDYAKQADFDTFSSTSRNSGDNNEDIARLRGVRFVTANESEQSKRINEPLIKRLTGGESVLACFKYGHVFEYRPRYKLFLAANHKPIIRGTDEGIWRRTHFIPYELRVEKSKRSKSLDKKLAKEGSGILAWLVFGCLEWQRLGDLNPSTSSLKATADYKADMDTLAQWIGACCVHVKNNYSLFDELYRSFKAYSEANDDHVMSKRSFSAALEERGYKKARGNQNVLVFYGLTLKGI